MELSEAIDILKNVRGIVIEPEECEISAKSLSEAINTVLQEIELNEIELTTVHIKGVCDEKERWKKKIREEMEKVDEEAFGKPYDVDTADGYHSQAMGMWCMCNKLLKGE